jgi:predicted dehydrogenase
VSEAGPAARPRLGFLGVGWIGRNRLEAVAESGAAEIAMVADPVPSALWAASAAAPEAAFTDSFEELLAQPLDGVVIATPSALHAGQAIAALERGMAVFCQKPLGRTAAETRRVVDAARAANRLLSVDLSYRYTTAMVRIRELIHAGAIGRVHAVDLVFHNAYGPDKPWFYERALSGGGCVMDLGIHLIDLVLWTLAPPHTARGGARAPRVVDMRSRLSARGQPIACSIACSDGASMDSRFDLAGGDQVEDFAAVQLDLDTGATVQLRCSWRLSAGQDAVIEASFYGTEGGASMRNVNGSFYDFCAEHYQGTARTVLAEPPDAWGGRALLHWVGKLASSRCFDAEAENLAEHLINVATAIDTIYTSASRHHD